MAGQLIFAAHELQGWDNSPTTSDRSYSESVNPSYKLYIWDFYFVPALLSL